MAQSSQTESILISRSQQSKLCILWLKLKCAIYKRTDGIILAETDNRVCTRIRIYWVSFYPRDAMLARSLRQRRVRTSVCPSVRPSHAGIVRERKQDREMYTPHDSSFWQGMSRRKIRKESPQRNLPNEGGLGFSAIFDQCVVISRKRCILDTKLLWNGNRKPYASVRMVSDSMTLSDP